MASLLIIGGSGFFGKSFLDGYLRGLLNPWNIDSIIVLSRHASKLKITTPELMHPSITLIDADIATCTTLPFADFVIHAAASTDIANYLDRPLQEQENIQRGTYNYCKLAKKFHRQSKILYVSSGAVYGKQPSDLEAIPEDFDPGPIELMDEGKRHYAAAKRDAEIAIKKLGKEELNVSIARCFSFVGKYLPRDQHFAIGNFIDNVLNNEPIKVNSKKLVYRSYMSADDLVRWLLTVTQFSTRECPIYNVGSSKVVTLDGLAQEIGITYGLNVEYAVKIPYLIDRYTPTIHKAQQSLGLQLQDNVMDVIRSVIGR